MVSNLTFPQVIQAVEACIDPANKNRWETEDAERYRASVERVRDQPNLWLGRMQGVWLIFTAKSHKNADAALAEWKRVLGKVQSGAMTWDEFVTALAAGKPPRAPEGDGE